MNNKPIISFILFLVIHHCYAQDLWKPIAPLDLNQKKTLYQKLIQFVQAKKIRGRLILDTQNQTICSDSLILIEHESVYEVIFLRESQDSFMLIYRGVSNHYFVVDSRGKWHNPIAHKISLYQTVYNQNQLFLIKTYIKAKKNLEKTHLIISQTDTCFRWIQIIEEAKYQMLITDYRSFPGKGYFKKQKLIKRKVHKFAKIIYQEERQDLFIIQKKVLPQKEDFLYILNEQGHFEKYSKNELFFIFPEQ